MTWTICNSPARSCRRCRFGRWSAQEMALTPCMRQTPRNHATTPGKLKFRDLRIMGIFCWMASCTCSAWLSSIDIVDGLPLSWCTVKSAPDFPSPGPRLSSQCAGFGAAQRPGKFYRTAQPISRTNADNARTCAWRQVLAIERVAGLSRASHADKRCR